MSEEGFAVSRDRSPAAGSALDERLTFKSPYRSNYYIDAIDVLRALSEHYPHRVSGTGGYTYGEIKIGLDAAIAALSSAKPIPGESSRDEI